MMQMQPMRIVEHVKNRFYYKIGIHLRMIIGFDVTILWLPFTENCDNDRHYNNDNESTTVFK